jgi:hypothetical protein
MIAHRKARGEGGRVELMQVKEEMLARASRQDGWARTTLHGGFGTCTLSYLLNPVTGAFRGKS